ncbi:DNA helicase [Tanacetum coccineum]
MSLQFALLFVFSEPGFYPDLLLKPQNGRGKGKKVTMNAYYKYQLHPRVKEFGLIFRSERLFQQYVVAVYYAIEMNRLDYIQKNQNDLRSDYLSGLYNDVSRGDREGIAAGSKILLPNTFTGGPRYIVLYTIEFQKRGLPHCHTLLWVDSKSELQDAQYIDELISAEIPDPVKDPHGYKLVTELMMHGPCGSANSSTSCTQGLLGDDKEWDIALQESTGSAASNEVKILFAQIHIYYDVSDPIKPWIKHLESMSEDIPAKISKATRIPNDHVNTAELKGREELQTMDYPNMTMEEYIKLEEEKACRRGRVFSWETATYRKIRADDDLHNLRSVEAEFLAIVINDAFAPQDALPCESQVSTHVNNEIYFRISFDESDDEDYTIIYDKNSFSYKMISVNKTDSKNNNEKACVPPFPPPKPTISFVDDLDFFKDFENEFLAIFYNVAQTSKSDYLAQQTLSPQHNNEYVLNDETSLSEYDKVGQNVLYFNDLFPFNVIYPDDLKSDKDNDNNEIDIIQSLEVLEDTDAYHDEGMGEVIVGEPFLREVGIKARRFDGMITIYNGDDEVTYQMVRSHSRFKHHTNEQCNKIPPLLKDPTLSEFRQWNNGSHEGTLACIRWNGEEKLKTSPVWGCDRLVIRAKVIENQIMAASAIAISSDSSDESVGSPPSQISTIAHVISSAAPVVETTLVASPTGLCGLVPYSDSDSDSPDEMSLSEHISSLLAISPFLCTYSSEAPDSSDGPPSQDSYVMTVTRWRRKVASRPSSSSEFPIDPVNSLPGIRRRSTILSDPGRLSLVNLTAPILIRPLHPRKLLTARKRVGPLPTRRLA